MLQEEEEQIVSISVIKTHEAVVGSGCGLGSGNGGLRLWWLTPWSRLFICDGMRMWLGVLSLSLSAALRNTYMLFLKVCRHI